MRATEAASIEGAVLSKAPYAGFRTFISLIDAMRTHPQEPLEAVLRAEIPSATARSELRTLLRSFQLVSGDVISTELIRFVRNPDARPAILRGLLDRYYSGALDVLRASGDRPALVRLFQAHGRSGSSASRAASLFIDMAEAAGLEVSHARERRSRPPVPTHPTAAVQPVSAFDYEAALAIVIQRWSNEASIDDAEAFARFEAICDRFERERARASGPS